MPLEICDLNLNEAFFHDNNKDVDSTYAELYPSDSSQPDNGQRRNSSSQRTTQRTNDPTEERDGCTSIACPAGYRSIREDKDGVFPCQECEHNFLNPYLGANKCFDIENSKVLLALYNATNGPSWTDDPEKTWSNSKVPPCQKKGVTCNSNNEIISLELKDMGLEGSLPEDLGFLRFMEILDVSQNKLTGRVPSELRWAPLIKLDLADNRMTGLVPLSLCQKLGINGNGIGGIFTCDTIACAVGYYNSVGHADEGYGGEKCMPCATGIFLGSTQCDAVPVTTFGMGYAGESILVLLGLAAIYGLWFLYKRSKIAKEEMMNISEYETDELNQPPDQLAGMGHVEVKVKDEWSSQKESTKEVWL
eukprot:CAMPEP_0118686634 /NCGR_PEP_ID=MMETSP0800-20121206/7925_1 /TAXON_ID=210618 ORGANISM="Striatella unipunctata, Strain CCMP2910" /NCGR_SAMPLE_ID=MMETSP0800 /ASSEMBLY_ACC=CAM_ASM_000638 /LENGTH=361 /DNA_ID=CAMNT_0006583707 /DNA_START=203 /DNA_END=1284 /DNA_ORIENTATION=-